MDIKSIDKIEQFITKIPKVELHLHIEGAIPLETLFYLIQRKGEEPSVKILDDLRNKLSYTDFTHFFDIWVWKNTFITKEDDFEDLMRTKDVSSLEKIFDPEGLAVDFNDPLNQILTFALCHKDKIKEEIEGLAKIDGVSRWTLELTTTSLFWLLSLWSERFDSMQVFCDKSKPLYENQAAFDAMVGRTDRVYMKLGKQPDMALTYNLAGPIVFLDSKESPGIQIADVISSSIAYAYKNRGEAHSEEWLKTTSPMFTTICILPEPDEIDLTKRDPCINAAILNELVIRTLECRSLFIDMEEYIATTRHAYRISPPEWITESIQDGGASDV